MTSRGTSVARAALVALAAAGGAACTGQIMGSGGGGDDDGGGDDAVTVAFSSPAAGSEHTREVLGDGGWLVAGVPVTVAIDGAPDAVEIAIGDVVLGEVDAAGELVATLRAPGPATLTARARRGGEVVAEATVDVLVVEPDVADCQGWLDLYQLAYTIGPNNQGVGDPVTVTTPINGMVHRYVANDTPRATFFMDCALALSLARAAPYLRARGVVEVADIGVYNYRCIGGGTPPDCPNGVSQHAYAKAIDIAGFTDELGTFYSVEDDWVIDPDGEDTCDAPTMPGADAFLHEAICELKHAGVWNIVLTPNYNAAHRDHFHVDLTPGSDFIEHGPLVDVGPDHH